MLIDVPFRQFQLPHVFRNYKGCCHIYTNRSNRHSYVTKEEQWIFEMDCSQHLPLLHGCAETGGAAATSSPTHTNVNHFTTTSSHSDSRLFYLVLDNTKVPLIQLQNPNAFKPDITGTLGLLDHNQKNTNLINPFTKLTENSTSFGPTPTIPAMFSNNEPGFKTNGNVLNNRPPIMSLKTQNSSNLMEKTENNQTSSFNINDRLFCNFCCEKFAKRIDFDNHFGQFHPDEAIAYTCSICRNQVKEFDKFRNHYYRHFHKGRFSCLYCSEYKFTQSEHVASHTRIFHPEQNEVFPKQDSNSEISKAEEQRSQTERKVYNLFCSICKTKFTNKETYEEHSRVKHAFYLMFYQCSLCRRDFKTFKHFENHTCTPKSQKQTSEISEFTNIETKFSPGKKSNPKSSSDINRRDPTLSAGVSNCGDWAVNTEPLSSHALDENQNSSGTLNKNNDDNNCEDILFEKTSQLNVFSNNIPVRDQINQTEQKTLKEFDTSKQDTLIQKTSPDILLDDNDLYSSFIPNDLLDYAESLQIDDDFDFYIDNLFKNPDACFLKPGTIDAVGNKTTTETSLPWKNLDRGIKSPSMASKLNKVGFIKSKEPYMVCYVCHLNFSNRDILWQHFKDKHSAWHVVYKCGLCSLNEMCFEKYDKHVCQLHYIRKTNLKCNHCEAVLETRKSLIQHTELHHKSEQQLAWTQMGFLCLKCNKKFPKKNLYEQHYRSKHSRSEGVPYTCARCTKQYFKFESFRAHCYSHVMSRRFKCSHCSRGFTKRSKLFLHERVVHFGENCSMTSSSSPGSATLYSPQSNLTYIMSPDYDCSYTDVDSPQEDILTPSDDTAIRKTFSAEYQNCFNSVDELLSPPKTTSILNSVETIESSEFQIDKNFSDSQSFCTDEYNINSPESGIDCANSPLSDIQNPLDYETKDSFSATCNGSEDDSIQVLCGVCQTKCLGRKSLEMHYSREHHTIALEYGCTLCRQVTSDYDAFRAHMQIHTWNTRAPSNWNDSQPSLTNVTLKLNQNNLKRKSNNVYTTQLQQQRNEQNNVVKSFKKNKIDTLGYKAISCFDSEPLSIDEIEDSRMKSVIETSSQDMKHSVICKEYSNKGLKYSTSSCYGREGFLENSRYGNTDDTHLSLNTENTDKITVHVTNGGSQPNIQNGPSSLLKFLDMADLRSSNHYTPLQKEDSKSDGIEIVLSENYTGDHGMMARNHEDFAIVVNDNNYYSKREKTEELQSRNIASDQCHVIVNDSRDKIQPSQILHTQLDDTSILQTGFTNFIENRGIFLIAMDPTTVEKKTIQFDKQIDYFHQANNALSKYIVAETPGEQTQQQIISGIPETPPLVFKINIFLSTSTNSNVSDIVDANDNRVMSSDDTQHPGSLPLKTGPPDIRVTGLRGFRRKPN